MDNVRYRRRGREREREREREKRGGREIVHSVGERREGEKEC